MEEYYPRLLDAELPRYLRAFGATSIQGPKGAGKTTTAKRYAQSVLCVQDPGSAANTFLTARTLPSLLLEGEKPRLIDEWQLIPWVWDAIRIDCDWTSLHGQYLLTNSFPARPGTTMHSGAGRIARLLMRPMSLYESKNSTGAVSLAQLFATNEFSTRAGRIRASGTSPPSSAAGGGHRTSTHQKRRPCNIPTNTSRRFPKNSP